MSASDTPSTSRKLLTLLRGAACDEAAWLAFVERYRPVIDRWIRQSRLQPADVDEVQARVLACLVRALRELDYDPARRFRGWLRTVVLNTVRSYWRERRKPGAVGTGGEHSSERLEQIEVPDPVRLMADELDDRVQADLQLAERAIARVVGKVAAHTWEAFWLTAILGRSAAEAAGQLGVSTAAVYMAKSRVAKMLRAEGESILASTVP
jgi:RNA polymerase sigma-70 factor (ECF subfamily)